ncbi:MULTISPECIES: terminase small subunit [unclassified Haematobacter]|uniref:terminase small subunit n=1 Tax=unclassified Haematobacter TaxID=2640585 RepID=UPI0025C3C254|nr:MULTISPECIES: terminase small subunit [unclassified Haematobacter]
MRIVQELPGLGDRPVHRIGGSDLCDLWGITPGALTGLVKREIAIRLGHDAYDLVESTRRYLEHLRGTASGRGGEEQILNLTGERARLAREQADAQALKNAALRGELVKADEVERAWADVLRKVRSRVLAVPSRLRQSLGHLTAADVDALDRELRTALEELGHADD